MGNEDVRRQRERFLQRLQGKHEPTEPSNNEHSINELDANGSDAEPERFLQRLQGEHEPTESRTNEHSTVYQFTFNLNLAVPNDFASEASMGSNNVRQILQSFFAGTKDLSSQSPSVLSPCSSEQAAIEPDEAEDEDNVTKTKDLSSQSPSVLSPCSSEQAAIEPDEAEDEDNVVDLTALEDEMYGFNFIRDFSDDEDDDDDDFLLTPSKRRLLAKRPPESPHAEEPAPKFQRNLRNYLASLRNENGSSSAGASASASGGRSATSSSRTAAGISAQPSYNQLRTRSAGVTGPSTLGNGSDGPSTSSGSFAASCHAAAAASASNMLPENQPEPNNGPAPRAHNPATCTVCLENTVDSILRCQHCFCGQCLATLKAMKKPCPICRNRFRKWKPLFLG